jgi:HD-GYP domain-containing protein (c-di-GMP phosphodiesterase class II)
VRYPLLLAGLVLAVASAALAQEGGSVTIGGVVYYLETEKVDDFVLDLAVKESKTLKDDTLAHLAQGKADPAKLQKMVEASLDSHFIIIELYDSNRKKVAEGMDPGEAVVEEKLKHRTHRFPFGRSVFYEKIYLDDELFLQVLLPMTDTRGQLAGYFEGVYRVDADTLDNIRHTVLRALVEVIVATLVTTIILYPVILLLNRELIRFSGELLKTNMELMEVLGSAVAKRDSDTHAHNYRVTFYAIRLAEALNRPTQQIRQLIAGAFLHDVGKIGISDAILLKPGKLTEEEFEVMKTHVAQGVDIIAKSEQLKGARDVVEFHHEKYDGKGYLKGLKGDEIPLNARIFAIVDVFDALTSKRPYKDPMPFDAAMDILRKDSGSHFDPDLVDAFDAIAAGLYRQMSDASEKEVEATLHHMAGKYFFNDDFLVEYLSRFKNHAPAAG